MKNKVKLKRISWNKYFFKIARLVSERSTCIKQKEGAVIVKNKRILTTGYNGAPAKLPHCIEIGCLREKRKLKDNEQLEICRGLEAIQNAVIQAATCGISIKDSTLYATHTPSITSVKIIINAGIKEILVPQDKLESLAASLLNQSRVKIRKIKCRN